MKKILILLSATLVVLAACRKYNSLGYTPGTGAPTITSVHTWYKTDSAVYYDTIVTYNSAGDTTLTVNARSNQIVPFDSVTDAGNLGQTYMIYGSNLGSAVTVAFNGASAYFNRAWNTDNSILVTIPSNTPTSGTQATDTLTVTTLHGTVRYHFVVITPPPTITTVSDYDFWGGSQVTLHGAGFAAVTSVGLSGSSATATIVSQVDSLLVLQFPTTTVNRCNLVFTYTSGGNALTTTSTQEFNDLDNAYAIVFKNAFQNAWVDASWSGPSGISTGASHSFDGTSSAEASYPAGGWKIEGWANWYPSFTYNAAYKYLTFWVRGGTVNHTLVLVGDQMAGGYSQNTSAPAIQQISVPAGVWTFYKIPLGTGAGQLNYWANGTTAKQLGFFLQGQSGDVNETMYFDEVAFLQ
ncbi:hypothetical protein [Dinghuibacter silviterrae]|uniref:IPT/TIG domain-containing protein n=1 Tax=Dinghuibacter silviterrae TaxID=1539049 RepID=A0A4R8DY78_9BACT|nr:hypothetical protein [Dinghuibacter silviterrae]TDX02407.1 hypothetical protein EDB95_3465 [Dinghuibacter silviterrae]